MRFRSVCSRSSGNSSARARAVFLALGPQVGVRRGPFALQDEVRPVAGLLDAQLLGRGGIGRVPIGQDPGFRQHGVRLLAR
jgi:hypothetical protein